MRRIYGLVALSCLLGMFAQQAHAAQYLFVAQRVNNLGVLQGPGMDGPSESPANASPGTATGSALYDDVAHTLALNTAFSGLTGTTTASHIHAATANPGVLTAGVATTTPSFAGFPLGVTSGSFSNTLDLTLASSYNPAYVTANGGTTTTAETALIKAMFDGKAYWNIHSSTFGGGEIRGFMTYVPEPTTFALCAFGVAGICAARRRRS